MGATQELIPLREKAEDAAAATTDSGPVQFGHKLKEQHFLFDSAYRNLNHGQ